MLPTSFCRGVFAHANSAFLPVFSLLLPILRQAGLLLSRPFL